MPVIAKFNDGRETSNTIERQFTPEKVLKAVVEFPKAKRPFSKLVSTYNMPKHNGDTVTQEIRHGMLEETNVLSGNIDPTYAKFAVGKIYSNNGNLFEVEEYLSDNAGVWDDALAAAMAAATADGGIKEYSPSGIIDGKSSSAVYSGELVPLPEEGGVYNGLMSKSSLVSAKISFHMIHTKYTERSVDLDSRMGMIARHISDLGDALTEIKEAQVQSALQKVANERRMISTNNAATITIDDMNGMDVITYETLETFGMELQNARVPMDTEMLKGVDLQDTVTVNDTYIMYINREVLPTLRRLKGPGDVLVWKDARHYAAGTELMEGEVGSIDGLDFRFVVAENLEIEKGAGVVVGGVDDTANATTQGNAYVTKDAVAGNNRYDIYSGLVIGADSFTVTGFGYNSTQAYHIPPKKDVYNDMTGSVGAVAAKWSFALLPYRPERIRKISFTLAKSGTAPVVA